jgi:hypothetical protein
MANLIDKLSEYRKERRHIKEALRLDNPDFW